MAEPRTFPVPGIGDVTLHGEGPWSVRDTGNAFGVSDAAGADARPALTRVIPYSSAGATKTDQNVSWAARSKVEAIIAVANGSL